MSDVLTILNLVASTLKLLAPTESGQTRKNIRMGYKNYKKIRKIMKKDGITPDEQIALDGMIDLLVKAQNKLLK